MDRVEEILNREISLYQSYIAQVEMGRDGYTNFLSLIRAHERAYLQLRGMPVYPDRPEDIPTHLAIGGEYLAISLIGEMVKIEFPGLLPFRKKDANATKALYALCYAQLVQFWEDHDFLRFDTAVLVFEHVRTGKEKCRDYDNYETKAIQDMVTRLFLPDDSPTYCSTYHTSRKGETAHTNVYLMQKKDFPEFIRLHMKDELDE